MPAILRSVQAALTFFPESDLSVPVTRVLAVNGDSPDPGVLDEAGTILARGGLVAFPTETVYGLGADALNVAAVRSVFTAKGRPPDNPLIVHLAEASQVDDVAVDIPAIARELARSFWPGPLTLVVRGRLGLPKEVTAGLPTVAVRVPDHRVPRELVRRLGRGIVGPSANTSGRPSPTEAAHVLADLSGAVDIILDAGPTRIGLESTVVDVTVEPPAILRQGGLTQEQLESVAGPLTSARDVDSLRRSPGTRHRHYAPSATVILIPRGDAAGILRAIHDHRDEGRRVGVIVHSVALGDAAADLVTHLDAAVAVYARQFYAALRAMDASGMQTVIVEEVDDSGLGRTLIDRMRRAAQPK